MKGVIVKFRGPIRTLQMLCSLLTGQCPYSNYVIMFYCVEETYFKQTHYFSPSHLTESVMWISLSATFLYLLIIAGSHLHSHPYMPSPWLSPPSTHCPLFHPLTPHFHHLLTVMAVSSSPLTICHLHTCTPPSATSVTLHVILNQRAISSLWVSAYFFSTSSLASLSLDCPLCHPPSRIMESPTCHRKQRHVRERNYHTDKT